jgi:small subunit ribosomal protein S7e
MASHKIAKPAGAAAADEVELSVAQALLDLENNVPELKKELRPLQISSAKEVHSYYPSRLTQPE